MGSEDGRGRRVLLVEERTCVEVFQGGSHWILEKLEKINRF